ncbi:MAG: DUF6444 domain-containing protein, partial [Microlunatus sp.]|nr:DUF6444 domain-containing protein [Microlunatus sp.]
MARSEELSREELLALVARQAGQIGAQAKQITTLTAQVAELAAANEALAGQLARLEHLLSRNSGNSSMPPSGDDGPGKTPPKKKQQKRAGPGRSRGKQPGAPGTNLAWSEDPDERLDRFPQGRCGCGNELADATDLGVTDRYQQHEIQQNISGRLTSAARTEDRYRIRGYLSTATK